MILSELFLFPDGRPDLLLCKRLLNFLSRPLDDTQSPQAQEIHLEQTHHLTSRPIPLRNDLVILSTRGFIQWDHFMQRPGRYDHTRRVHTRMSSLPFKGSRSINHPFNHCVRVIPILQIRLLLKRLIERDSQFFRNQLCELVRITQRHLKHARHIADTRSRLECTKGNDLRHMSVLLADIVDHIDPPVLTQIDINIGIFRSIRISESFKEQTIMYRTRVGQTKHIPTHRPHTRTTRDRRNSSLTTPVDKVPNN